MLVTTFSKVNEKVVSQYRVLKRVCGLYFQHIITEIQRKQNLKPQIDTFIPFNIFCLGPWTISCIEILLLCDEYIKFHLQNIIAKAFLSLNLKEIYVNLKKDVIQVEVY